VPRVNPEAFLPVYRALQTAATQSLTASVRGLYRGGLGIQAALVAMGGGFGLTLDLAEVRADTHLPDEKILFAESAGRFLITVDPRRRAALEALFEGLPLARIGTVTRAPQLVINGQNGEALLKLDVDTLRRTWEKPYGEMI
jgi:phosphoribosylformylglycinamidine synthase